MLSCKLQRTPRIFAFLSVNNTLATTGTPGKKSALPSQIGSLVGAYLISVCIVGLIISCLSRRRRKRLQMLSGQLSTEMMELSSHRNDKDYGASRSTHSRMPNLPRNSGNNATSQLPSTVFNPGIDIQVIEADREKLSQDLEAIYAHVMAEEDAKAFSEDSRELPSSSLRYSANPKPTYSQRSQVRYEQKLESNTAKPMLKLRSNTTTRALSLLSSFRTPRKKSAQPLSISSPILISSPDTPRTARTNKVSGQINSHVVSRQPPDPSNLHPYPRDLPLRQFEECPHSSNGISSGTTLTILERVERPDSLRTGMTWSAGAVPYSPYQPYSPVIPVTPKLVTKKEMKLRRKLESKIQAVELIKSEEELWDSAY